MNIVDKYNSEFASFYKEKLVAVCEGREWTMPPIGSRKKAPVQAAPKVAAGVAALGNGIIGDNLPSKSRNEAYFSVDFALSSVKAKRMRAGLRMYVLAREVNTLVLAAHMVPIFETEPEERSSTRMPDNLLEDPVATLTKGWSLFTTYASKGAKLAVNGAETLGRTLNENVQSTDLGDPTNHCSCSRPQSEL